MRTKAGEGALSETTVLFPSLVKMSLDNVRLISYTMVRRDCHGGLGKKVVSVNLNWRESRVCLDQRLIAMKRES